MAKTQNAEKLIGEAFRVTQDEGETPSLFEIEGKPIALFSGEVHPVAAMFPMMSDEELDDLAEDIKANGLLHPVILDAQGVLIDGRNRMEACIRADVEPTFGLLNGHDPVAFIFSSNNQRRHMTKGQMVMVKVMSEPADVKTQSSSRDVADEMDVNQVMVVRARMVRQWASDLVPSVIDATETLNKAHEKAQENKRNRSSAASQMAELEREAGDLATQVKEGRLALPDAMAAMRERVRAAEQEARLASSQLNRVLVTLDPGGVELSELASAWLKADEKHIGADADLSAARARRAANVLIEYACLKERNNRDG